MVCIENKVLKVTVHPKGAELKSIFHKHTNLEYLWQANPAFWAKSSPVLFPIVGELKNTTYQYKNKTYVLPRHGFARDHLFTVTAQTNESVTYTLQSDPSTLTLYPFSFLFSIVYTLQLNELQVTYRVENKGEEDLFFSVGGHPAFNVPLVPGTDYADYKLVFNKEENAGRWPISKEGLIKNTPQPLLNGSRELPLSKSLFAKDAVVLKHLQSDNVQLVSAKTAHGLTFSFSGFPYLGLWAAPAANFVCIEPWCGIADSVEADGDLTQKEGIQRLTAGSVFTVAWKVRVY